MRIEREPIEFEWDAGNIGKNGRHRVGDSEAEEIFFDENKVMLADSVHSKNESRHILLGKTKKGRALFVVFTRRRKKIRIISARDVNKKEISLYEKAA